MVSILQEVSVDLPNGIAAINEHMSSLQDMMKETVRSNAQRLQLPIASAGVALPFSPSSYPILPPTQHFGHVHANDYSGVQNKRLLVEGLAEAPEPLRSDLAADRWARLSLCENGRRVIATSSVRPGQLVLEHRGEVWLRRSRDLAGGITGLDQSTPPDWEQVVENGRDLAEGLATCGAIWPSHICLLSFGASPLSLDVSRIASAARLAEHSMDPSCELQPWRAPLSHSQPLSSGSSMALDATPTPAACCPQAGLRPTASRSGGQAKPHTGDSRDVRLHAVVARPL